MSNQASQRTCYFEAMGSPCQLVLLTRNDRCFVSASSSVKAEVARLERAYSRFLPDSEVSAVNRAAEAGLPIEVSDEFVFLLQQAEMAHQASCGLFDITAGGLTRLWFSNAARRPEAGQINAALMRTGLQHIRRNGHVLEFNVAGLQLDLGGVVKEYAVDQAASICRKQGILSGFVNFGGDISILGPQADGKAWRIGVRDPRGGPAIVTLFATHGAIATSGNYERYVEIHGVRYGHLIDPRTGWPIDGCASVTVVGDSCLHAGLAATSSILAGPRCEDWLRQHNLRYLIVGMDGVLSGPLVETSDQV